MSEGGASAARRWRSILAEAWPLTTVESKFQVVFVCTGNRFRSPLAAALFRREVAGLPVAVESAGTVDVGPRRVFAETLEQAHRLQVDLTNHRARHIGSVSLGDADLVVGFERTHAAATVINADARRDSTFTLPELVQLLEVDIERPNDPDPASRARAVIQRADAIRAVDPAIAAREIDDPVGGSSAAYRRTADEINDLVARLAIGLFGSSLVSPLSEGPGRESRPGSSPGP